eukprot:TRINITY_DN245_c0_g1_i1.p3 TRINITY_DN245_c0_g1~~TRINITY_DN245_c0_g1_i1.p3  ORF type:complete len:130 (-),score=16.79 TRINITY_DN245_c0_g1_i1:42-407(-)
MAFAPTILPSFAAPAAAAYPGFPAAYPGHYPAPAFAPFAAPPFVPAPIAEHHIPSDQYIAPTFLPHNDPYVPPPRAAPRAQERTHFLYPPFQPTNLGRTRNDQLWAADCREVKGRPVRKLF